nr:beta-catenin-like protein 1 [Quercus suber]
MATVYSTLMTVENLVEVKPAVAEMVCERTKLLKWLLGKIKVREFDSNKQYASEILAILLQNSAANQRRVGQMNNVDVVLQSIAVFFMPHPVHCLLFKKCGGRVLGFNVSLVIEEVWVVASGI